MAGYHAVIAPSDLARTVACNAWIQLSQGLPPEPDTEETQEGNAADWVVKQYAAGNELPHGTPIPLPGGFSVDYDMIHGAKQWLDVIGYGSVSGVPVVIERIHPTDCWGEPDGWRWDAIEGVLRVPDYKYGFGVVDVFENWQLMAYAIGLIDTLKLRDTEMEVQFTIVQPRAFHKDGPVRGWKVRGDKLRAFANIAHHAAHKAWPPESERGVGSPPEAKTGPHCLHCPARVHCQTFQQAVTKVVEFIGAAHAVALPPAALGIELGILEAASTLLEGRLSALRTQAETLLRAGQRVPGFGMEPGQSRLQWNEGVTAAEVLSVGDLLGKNLRKPPGALNSRSGPLVTPTQAIKAGIDAAVIHQYSSRPPAPMQLARVSTTEARRAFGDSNT